MSRADRGSRDDGPGQRAVGGGSLQVRVLAGVDPVTAKDRHLSATVKGADRAALRTVGKDACGRRPAGIAALGYEFGMLSGPAVAEAAVHLSALTWRES